MIYTIAETVTDLWRSGRRTTKSPSGWISGNAVCCEHRGHTRDNRGRGGLHLDGTGAVVYHCFNCNFTASYQIGRQLSYTFRRLLGWMGADENTINKLVLDSLRVKDYVDVDTIGWQREPIEIDFPNVDLPPNSVNILDKANDLAFLESNENFRNVVEYALSRQIDLMDYPLFWCDSEEDNFNKRLIIPFMWENRIVGYTSRAIEDGISPKYKANEPPNYVFNVDNQSPENQIVIVCEGPIDAMSIDCVSLMGNDCNEGQAQIIESLGKEIIVVPDADTSGKELVDSALKYGWSVSYPTWQENVKDINAAVCKYGQLYVLKDIVDNTHTNKLKIELLKKRLR